MSNPSLVSLVKIALVDDDATMADVLSHKLGQGFEIRYHNSVNSLLQSLGMESPDIFMVDVHMPMHDGFEVADKLMALPENQIRPLVFMSHDVSYATILRCLRETGADFFSKDMPAGEMRARIHNIVFKPSNSLVRIGDLEVDMLNLKAEIAGQPIDLTLKEFKILNTLLNRPRRCMHRSHLLRQAWNDASVSEKTLNSHLSNLRQKIAPARVTIQIDRDGIIELSVQNKTDRG